MDTLLHEYGGGVAGLRWLLDELPLAQGFLFHSAVCARRGLVPLGPTYEEMELIEQFRRGDFDELDPRKRGRPKTDPA